MTIALYDASPNELKHIQELVKELEVLYADVKEFSDLKDLTEVEEEEAWNDTVKRISGVLKELSELMTPLKVIPVSADQVCKM